MSIQYTIYFFGRQQFFDGCQHQLSDGKPSQPSPFWTSWARLVFHTRDFVREKRQQKSKQETNSCNHIQMSEHINVPRHFFVFFLLVFFPELTHLFCLSNLSVSLQDPVPTQNFFPFPVQTESYTATAGFPPSSPDLPKLSNLSSTSHFPDLSNPQKNLQTSSSFEFDRQPDMP